MEAVAISKHIRMSPRKMRRVLNLVLGKNVNEALNTLHYTPKSAAEPIAKAITSAFANLGSKEEGERIEMSNVFIKEAYVDGGPTLKRFRPMSMGRAGRIRKRTSHLTVVVEDRYNDLQ
ncbi:MAG: 50S ribosomal protein L22 [Calditrichaceae bacterium]|nr:50S ribosomal protein L22 [Calditrichaceae bacterium]MBN2709096.1 50S ribosomal protein L22 [Calditrichaceae bacterium]RQV97053.1 MAG: 50S ribosomal protein L22 [Calditrichota bacterium]